MLRKRENHQKFVEGFLFSDAFSLTFIGVLVAEGLYISLINWAYRHIHTTRFPGKESVLHIKLLLARTMT